MLKIQEFIHEHENWQELLSNAPYNLKITEDECYVLFKYNQISSDFHEEICREARGLILEKGTWRVVRMAFEKFFNIDEPFANKIDWSSAVATEKIDGSIMSLWFNDGKWHLSTNGSIDAYKAQLANDIKYKTFGELFDAAAQLCGLDYSLLNPAYCYTFELVSPYNKVVIAYPDPAIYLLSVRDMDTLEEKIGHFDIGKGVLYPKEYNLNSEEEFRQIVEDMPEGHEGIVVRDEFGSRVKIKTLLYFELHRKANNGVLNTERVVDLIRANDYEEFLSYFPEYREYFESVKKVLDDIPATLWEIQLKVDGWKSRNQMDSETTRRRWFSQEFGVYQLKTLYFMAYDGRLQKFVDNMTTKQLIRMFGLEDKR